MRPNIKSAWSDPSRNATQTPTRGRRTRTAGGHPAMRETGTATSCHGSARLAGALTPGGRMDEERRHGGISDRPRPCSHRLGADARSTLAVGSCSACCAWRCGRRHRRHHRQRRPADVRARPGVATSSQLQWIVDAYTIVFASFLLIAGNTGDRLGRKRCFLGGLVVFGAGSLGCSLVGTPASLILLRGVQGFGAAFIMPATLSILANVFTRTDRAGPGHRPVGRRLRPRRGDRPARRRLPARALLVGLDLPHQRADRRS